MPHGEMDNSLWGNFMLTNWCFGGIMVETVVVLYSKGAIGQSIVFLLYVGDLTKRFRFDIMLKNGGGAWFWITYLTWCKRAEWHLVKCGKQRNICQMTSM